MHAYAARMNIQLLKAADFNSKLHQRGCSIRTSVQKICKIAKDEKQVREILQNIWKNPKENEQIFTAITKKNKAVYEFEKLLEEN